MFFIFTLKTTPVNHMKSNKKEFSKLRDLTLKIFETCFNF